MAGPELQHRVGDVLGVVVQRELVAAGDHSLDVSRRVEGGELGRAIGRETNAVRYDSITAFQPAAARSVNARFVSTATAALNAPIAMGRTSRASDPINAVSN